MERKRKAKKRKGKAQPAEAEVGKTERLVCLKRDNWVDHCIPCRERRLLLEEIEYWLKRVPTCWLPDVLARVAKHTDDSELMTNPVYRTRIPDDYSPLLGGVVILPEDEEEHDANGVRVALGLKGLR